jgi:gentisate 1,2-dioxygenase
MYTVVDGEPIPMETGDLLLTPQGAWHGHENKSDQTATWLDGLTSPFIVEGIHAPWFEDHDSYRQDVDKPTGYHNKTYGNLHPANTNDGSKTPPAYRYPWEETHDALRMAVETDSGPANDPYDGIRFEFVNPKTGEGPALETMSVFIQLNPSGEQTETHRHNTTELYYVVEGEGTTKVGDRNLDWKEGDSFIVPPNEWHCHETTSNKDAILFVMSDDAIFNSFSLKKEESK